MHDRAGSDANFGFLQGNPARLENPFEFKRSILKLAMDLVNRFCAAACSNSVS
jgi:hypothetical protein